MNTHILLGPGGYKYPFLNGVLEFFKENDKHFNIITMTGCSVGTTAGVAFLSNNNYNHFLGAESWLSNGRLYQTTKRSLSNGCLFEIDSDFFRLYINKIEIQRSPIDLFFAAYNTKTKVVEYFRIKDYLDTDKIKKLMVACCTVPHISPIVLGSEETGYFVDAAMLDPYPIGIMRQTKYRQDLKICVMLTNPYLPRSSTLRNNIATRFIEPFIFRKYPRKNDRCEKQASRRFIADNPDIVCIYPSTENSHLFDDTFSITPQVARQRFYDGYNQAKRILSSYISTQKPNIKLLSNVG